MVEIKLFTVMQISFGIIQFGLFLAILFIEIFVVYSSKINRWISIFLMLAISLLILFSTCIKKLRVWVSVFGRGYRVGITVFVAGALVVGDSPIEARSIVAYVIAGVAVGYIILSTMFEKKEDEPSFVTFNNQAHIDGNQVEKTTPTQGNPPPAPSFQP